MYKYVLAAMFLVNYANACDFCGCSPSVMNTDVLSLQPQSSLGTSVQYRKYKYLSSDANLKQTQVVTQNFFLSYAPKKWVDIRLSIPISWMFNNYIKQDANTPNLNEKKFGIGDLVLFSNFKVFSKPGMGAHKTGHIINLGYGMSFPTGSKKTSTNEWLQDFNFGTQSVAFYFAGTYSLSIRNWSLVNSALVKLNMYNKDRIKYGNMYSYEISANYTYFIKKVSLMPIVGFLADISQKNLHNQIIQGKSGSWSINFDVGLQCSVKDFGISVNVSQPMAQNTSANTILQKTGVSCMVRYQIKRKLKINQAEKSSVK